MQDKGIVLLSGGMDSLVTAAIASMECSEVYFLHVKYGQRTEIRELEAFQSIRDFYQPSGFMVCDIGYLKQIGASSLIDTGLEIERDIKPGEIPSTYVPFRNAHLLAIATSWAEVLKAGRIYIGAVEEDSSGYPDCREVFLNAFNEAVNLGTKGDGIIEIRAPLLHLSKREIIIKGTELKAPFHYSWSCYQANDIACGTCPSCTLRLKAFQEAGIDDPLPYRCIKEY